MSPSVNIEKEGMILLDIYNISPAGSDQRPIQSSTHSGPPAAGSPKTGEENLLLFCGCSPGNYIQKQLRGRTDLQYLVQVYQWLTSSNMSNLQLKPFKLVGTQNLVAISSTDQLGTISQRISFCPSHPSFSMDDISSK